MALSAFFFVTNERKNSAKILHVQAQPKKSVFLYHERWSYKKILYSRRKDLLEGGLMVLPTMAFSSQ